LAIGAKAPPWAEASIGAAGAATSTSTGRGTLTLLSCPMMDVPTNGLFRKSTERFGHCFVDIAHPGD
jgi:hypothetical protein